MPSAVRPGSLRSGWRRVVSTDFVRRDVRVALAPWAVARALVLGALWMSRFLADKLPASARTNGPLAGLFAYDGGWYREIAERDGHALVEVGAVHENDVIV